MVPWKNSDEPSNSRDAGVSKKQRGFAVSLEGPDKCGKSTQAKLLAHWLESNRIKFVVLDRRLTHVGRFILDINERDIPLSPSAKTLLYATEFTTLTSTHVVPTLENGGIVVHDRWVHSALAYGPAMGLPVAWIEEVHRHIPAPDLVLVIDAPPEVALQRLRESRELEGYYDSGYNPDIATREKSFLEFQAKVRERYRLLAEACGNVRVIDATKSRDEVHASVMKIFLDSLHSRNMLVELSA